MNFILRVTTYYGSTNAKIHKNYSFKTEGEAINKIANEMSNFDRLIYASDITDIVGYDMELVEWLGANSYRKLVDVHYNSGEEAKA